MKSETRRETSAIHSQKFHRNSEPIWLLIVTIRLVLPWKVVASACNLFVQYFNLAPLVHMWIHEHVLAIHWKRDRVNIIISPLLLLMQDQIKELSSLRLKAAFVGPEQDPTILEDIEWGSFTYVYLSPESALTTERWRNTLKSEIFQERLIGVAVDEVHCVTEWGTLSNNKIQSAFCVWYSCLNEIRSLVDVPFIALTATATQQTRDKNLDLLELRKPREITKSPNKINVRYTVQKLDYSLSIVGHFCRLINNLKPKGKVWNNVLIYLACLNLSLAYLCTMGK